MAKNKVIQAYYAKHNLTKEFSSVKKCALNYNIPAHVLYYNLNKNKEFIINTNAGIVQIKVFSKKPKWYNEITAAKIYKVQQDKKFRYQMVDTRQQNWQKEPAVTTANNFKTFLSIVSHRHPCTIGQLQYAIKMGYFKPFLLIKGAKSTDVSWTTLEMRMKKANGVQGQSIAIMVSHNGRETPYRSMAAAGRATGINWWDIRDELKARNGYAVINGIIFKQLNKV